MTRRRWFVPLAVLAGAVPARGADPGDAADVPQGEVVLEELVIKSGKPSRVDTLEVREVRETNARDLGEALDQQMGLAKVRKAGIANDLVLRGMKKDDINVLVDGARIHGACPSRMDPPSFHLDYAEVDRVEVRRGPFDVTQPGGLGGMVDVRTRAAPRGFGTELNASFGSFGAAETSAVGSYGGGRADLLLGGAFKTSHPYASGDGRNFTLAVPDTSTARFRDTSSSQTAYDIRSGWAKVGLVPAAGQRAEVAYTRQSAGDVLYPYLTMDGLSDVTDRVNATWRLVERAGPISRALAQAYGSRVEHGMDDRLRCSSAAAAGSCTGALPRAYSMRTDARSSVYGGKLEAGLGGGDALLEGLVGVDVYVRNWDNTTTRVMRANPALPYADEASIPDVTITDIGAYGEIKRPLRPGLRATAGARLDVASTHAAIDRTAVYATFFPGEDVSRSRTDVLFAGNAQIDVDVATGASVFLGYGHGTRLPDPQERYIALTGMMGRPTWVGQPALRPTRSDELDLGAKWASSRVLAKAQAYYAWYQDYVTLANVTVTPGGGMPLPGRTYDNVRAQTWGGEASARLALPAHLFATAQIAYTHGENATAGTPLAEIPPLRAGIALRWDVSRFFAEVEEQWAARQDRVDPALSEQPTAAWYITNVRVGADWKGLRGFLGVRNLLDRFYFEHLSYQRDPFATGIKVPEPGRTVYGTLQYTF